MKKNQSLRVKTPAPPRHIGEAVGPRSDHVQTNRSVSRHDKPSRNTSIRSGRVSPLSAPASPVHYSRESLVWALQEPEPIRPLRNPDYAKKPSQHHLRNSQLLDFAQADGFAMGFQQAGPNARQPQPPQSAKSYGQHAGKAARAKEQWTDIPLGNVRAPPRSVKPGLPPKPAYSHSRHHDAFQQLTRAEAGKIRPQRAKKALARHVDFSAPTRSKAGSNAWMLALLVVGIVAFGALLIGMLVGKKADSK